MLAAIGVVLVDLPQLADRDVCSEAGIDMQKPQEVSTFDQGNRVKRVGQ